MNICEYCDFKFTTTQSLKRHYGRCKEKDKRNLIVHYESQIENFQQQIQQYEKQLENQREQYEKQLEKLENHIQKLENQIFEIDVFYGENEGLIIAEIELSSTESVPLLPDWIGEEVTGQIKYYNSQLSKKPYKSW